MLMRGPQNAQEPWSEAGWACAGISWGGGRHQTAILHGRVVSSGGRISV